MNPIAETATHADADARIVEPLTPPVDGPAVFDASTRAQLRAALTVRPALRGDLVPLQFFFDALLRRDYFLRRGQLAEMIRGRRHRVLVAEIHGILVGVAILTRRACLVNVLVHPAYRGLNIGRALVELTDAVEVRAKINMSTGDPRGFYEAIGFVPVGRPERGTIQRMVRADPASAAPATSPSA